MKAKRKYTKSAKPEAAEKVNPAVNETPWITYSSRPPRNGDKLIMIAPDGRHVKAVMSYNCLYLADDHMESIGIPVPYIPQQYRLVTIAEAPKLSKDKEFHASSTVASPLPAQFSLLAQKSPGPNTGIL